MWPLHHSTQLADTGHCFSTIYFIHDLFVWLKVIPLGTINWEGKSMLIDFVLLQIGFARVTIQMLEFLSNKMWRSLLSILYRNGYISSYLLSIILIYCYSIQYCYCDCVKPHKRVTYIGLSQVFILTNFSNFSPVILLQCSHLFLGCQRSLQ